MVIILVVSETHFVRAPDGSVYSRTGVDGYPFWRRYLDVFDHVLVAARTGTAGCRPDLTPVEGPGVEVVPLPDYLGPWGHLRTRGRLRRTLGAGVARADVICLRAPGAIAGAAWRRRCGRPVGVEVVGDPLDALGPSTVRSVVRPLARALLVSELRAMCREAAAVAYVTAGALQERYPTPAWSTHYSSIDLADDAFASEAVLAARRARAARRGTAEDPWRIVFVGSLAQLYKGPDILIDAVGLCRRQGLALELTIVGEGRWHVALAERVRACGLGPHVRFAGWLPAGGAVRAELDRADVFVLPSRTEGLSRALLEAMARGLPCIGTAVGGIPELLPPERLVPPGDARALAAALVTVCAPSTDLASLALRNRAVARGYRRDLLRPRRLAFYARLRAATTPAAVL